jgi:hypothetical protein
MYPDTVQTCVSTLFPTSFNGLALEQYQTLRPMLRLFVYMILKPLGIYFATHLRIY